MAFIADYFEQAQLSLAAYALNLQRGTFGSQNTEYVTRLVDAGMSLTQAESFANTYAVVDQFTDFLSGFSGTVFDKSGSKFVAIRGTDGQFLFSGAVDWLTNISEVGPEGVAIRQSLAMFNWLQRLYGAESSEVVQYSFNPLTRTISTTAGIASGLLSTQPQFSVTGHSLGGASGYDHEPAYSGFGNFNPYLQCPWIRYYPQNKPVSTYK